MYKVWVIEYFIKLCRVCSQKEERKIDQTTEQGDQDSKS